VSQTPGKLERRARALLRAYPAEYRDGRAEEIIGTLLEAAPPGRSFPAAREAWSLVLGGRHARAARNRRPGVKANVRLALLLGISIYLSAGFCMPLVWNVLGFWPGGRVSLLTTTTLAFGSGAALAPWLGSRVATTAVAVPAGALYAYQELRGSHDSTTVTSLAGMLILIAALTALSGGPARLPRSWLWLPCAFPLALAAGRLLHPRQGPDLASFLELDALVLLAVVVVCWLVTDARPAFALCLAVLLQVFMTALLDLTYGVPLGMLARLEGLESFLIWFAFVLPVMIPAAWLLLRRQKAPGPHPYPGP
jgi:hypothetical protein